MTVKRTHITQGERAVGQDKNEVISTILGSCVSCCLWDPEAQVGGMNHMLLAVSPKGTDVCNLAGVNAMELLINDILKLGAKRERLRAKAFGGAKMISGLSDIGKINSDFTLDFLSKEGITCEKRSLGGAESRQIIFWPATGRAMQKIRTGGLLIEEIPESADNSGNGLELF